MCGETARAPVAWRASLKRRVVLGAGRGCDPLPPGRQKEGPLSPGLPATVTDGDAGRNTGGPSTATAPVGRVQPRKGRGTARRSLSVPCCGCRPGVGDVFRRGGGRLVGANGQEFHPYGCSAAGNHNEGVAWSVIQILTESPL